MGVKFTEKYPGESIRSLSWKQPYASLMLHGKVETRVWDSKYFGWVLICASKAGYSFNDVYDISGQEHTINIDSKLNLTDRINRYAKLPMGKAIAICKLSTSKKMGDLVDEYLFKDRMGIIKQIEDDCFVKYQRELFMHTYEDVQPIEPFDWHGTQGWKTLDQETMEKIIIL